MKSFIDGFVRFSVSGACLLGFALAIGSASLLSGCDDGKSQTKMIEQKDDPAVIDKDSMDAFKKAHTLTGAAKKK